jgi:hypothetical protein
VSVTYGAIGWNRAKRAYDAAIGVGIVVYLGLFVGTGALAHADATIETLTIRALATLAFLMLHVILSIGPLARLNPRLLPLLYNRRHLGVATFFVALAHASFAIVQFHALGNVNPFVSLLTAGWGPAATLKSQMRLAGGTRKNRPMVRHSRSNLFEQYRGRVRWAAKLISRQRDGEVPRGASVQFHTRLLVPGMFGVGCISTRWPEVEGQIQLCEQGPVSMCPMNKPRDVHRLCEHVQL